MWYKHVQIAAINYNTSFHESLGCEPTTVPRTNSVQHPGHQRRAQDRQEKIYANADLTDELQKQIAEIHQSAKDNLMQSCLKYKRYYDKKRQQRH